MLSTRLVLRDMCYCVHIHAKWLPTSSSKTTQGIPQTFVFICLVDLRLFSDNLHQINIGKKDKIFMYIIKYIVVILPCLPLIEETEIVYY